MTVISDMANNAIMELEELKAQMSHQAAKAARLHRRAYKAEVQQGQSEQDLAITLCTEAALWEDAGRIVDAMIVYKEALELEMTEKYKTWIKKQLQILKLKSEYLKLKGESDDL